MLRRDRGSSPQGMVRLASSTSDGEILGLPGAVVGTCSLVLVALEDVGVSDAAGTLAVDDDDSADVAFVVVFDASESSGADVCTAAAVAPFLRLWLLLSFVASTSS